MCKVLTVGAYRGGGRGRRGGRGSGRRKGERVPKSAADLDAEMEVRSSHLNRLVDAYLLSIRITPLAMRLRQLDHQVLMFVNSRNSSFVCEP
jgi:hypothetical protein